MTKRETSSFCKINLRLFLTLCTQNQVPDQTPVRPKRVKNHTLWDSIQLHVYSPYKGVPSPGQVDASELQGKRSPRWNSMYNCFEFSIEFLKFCHDRMILSPRGTISVNETA